MGVRRVAAPGAIVQRGVATAMGWALARWWGWDRAAVVVFVRLGFGMAML